MNEQYKTRSLRYIKQENVEEINETENQEKEIKHPFLRKLIFIILMIILIFIAYSRFIEPKLIAINEYKIESNTIPESFHGFKIIHFSDLHYGTAVDIKQLNKLVTKINELKPDIIFFTGDLIDQSVSINEETKTNIIDVLKTLNASMYKYAIYGDEDINNEFFEDILKQADFQILNNESTLLYYKNNTPIQITGFNSRNEETNYTILTDFVNEVDTTDFYKIVLTHEPDSVDHFINYNPNLVLSGHSLGGEINIFKPLFLNEGSKKYYKDYNKINETDFYISNGLGTSSLYSRFNNPPSFNLYRIYKI